jgi:hypothetical protein
MGKCSKAASTSRSIKWRVRMVGIGRIIHRKEINEARFTITVEGFDAAEQAGPAPSPTQRQLVEPKNEN